MSARNVCRNTAVGPLPRSQHHTIPTISKKINKGEGKKIQPSAKGSRKNVAFPLCLSATASPSCSWTPFLHIPALYTFFPPPPRPSLDAYRAVRRRACQYSVFICISSSWHIDLTKNFWYIYQFLLPTYVEIALFFAPYIHIYINIYTLKYICYFFNCILEQGCSANKRKSLVAIASSSPPFLHRLRGGRYVGRSLFT